MPSFISGSSSTPAINNGSISKFDWLGTSLQIPEENARILKCNTVLKDVGRVTNPVPPQIR